MGRRRGSASVSVSRRNGKTRVSFRLTINGLGFICVLAFIIFTVLLLINDDVKYYFTEYKEVKIAYFALLAISIICILIFILKQKKKKKRKASNKNNSNKSNKSSGGKKTTTATKPVKSEPAKKEAPKSAGGKRCPYCDSLLDGSDKFCKNCGGQV